MFSLSLKVNQSFAKVKFYDFFYHVPSFYLTEKLLTIS